MNITLEPNCGVSCFVLGEKIENYLSIYPYNFIKGDENESWDEYDFFDELVEIYVDKKSNLIESIACRHNCIYKNINLIGCDFHIFLRLINKNIEDLECEKLWMKNYEQQSVYEIEDMLLQIWVNLNNEIISIFVG